MANRTIKIYGNNMNASTALVVAWDGIEVYNGTLSASVVTYADIYGAATAPEEILEFTFNNADDTIETNHALSVTCTGEAHVGEVYVISNNDNANYDEYPSDGKPPVTTIGGKHYWTPGNEGIYRTSPYNGSADDTGMPERINVLINDVVPTHTGYTGASDGTKTFSNTGFHLTTSDVLTCQVRVPTLLGSGGGNDYVPHNLAP